MQNYRLSKRKKTALRFFSYGVMTLAVLVLSVFCILLILGFQFNVKNGTLEQGGLFQFRSFPSGASLDLDGKQLSFRTPGKLNAVAGDHTVTMKLNGYQDWQKKTTLKAGELKWLNYARLVPQTITSRTVNTFTNVTDTLPSPDRQWYSLITDLAAPVVTLYDIRDPKKPVASNITIPAGSFTTVAGVPDSFSIDEWDFGARFMLIKHQSGTTVEFIRVDRTLANETLNVTKEFNLPFSEVHFSGTSGNVFYALNGTDLRKIDLGNKSVSQPLVSDVVRFELYKSNVIAYEATHIDKRIVGVYINDEDTLVRSYPLDESVQIDISSYYDHEYLAIGHGKTIEIIKDPLENTDSAGRVFATFTTAYDIAWVQLASSGRFLVAGNGTDISTYDIETDELFISRFEGTAQNVSRPLQWLDDYYLVSDATSSLVIGEFDGTNRHDIVSVAPGYAVTLSEDGEYLFSIGRTATGFTLQSSHMIND
ncbi:PEGA domain-containing protein [Pedobacter sp.]|nr:PEGA domain-containing protein [Candidatus Saccharibacteria bacterium]